MMLIIGVNSYMSLEEAKTLLESELLDTDIEYTLWNSLDDNKKEKLIIRGTRLIDTLPFRGLNKTLYDVNGLHWPRYIDNNLVECPDDIKIGLIIQSLRDINNKNKKETELLDLGVTSYKVKDASISFDPSRVNKLNNGVYADIFNNYFKKWVR